MNRHADTSSPVRALRAARLRHALMRLARSRGRHRGYPIRRLVEAVGRLPDPGSVRILKGIHPRLIDLMPSALFGMSCMGLGLAGGGGGSPGSHSPI